MAKQKCERCGRPFSRLEIFKTAYRGFQNITCPNCGTKHTVLEHYKVIIPCVITLPVIPFYLLISPYLKITAQEMFLYGLVIVILSLCTIPFFVKYEIPDNPKQPKEI